MPVQTCGSRSTAVSHPWRVSASSPGLDYVLYQVRPHEGLGNLSPEYYAQRHALELTSCRRNARCEADALSKKLTEVLLSAYEG